MIGRLLCLIGLHEWWHRSSWPEAAKADSSAVLANLSAVCGRCPAKRYRQ